MQQDEESSLRQRRSKKIGIIYGNVNLSASNRNDLKETVSVSVGFALIFVFLILIKLFVIFENSLPAQIQVKDAKKYPGRFIGQRAELQLKRLTSLGTRVVGSYENEVLAIDFLRREVLFVEQEANKIHKIEVDVQKPIGSYSFLDNSHGFRNCYANIQNFVVKLSSENSPNSILMNCHFDTVPESPGASDNGVNCVVLLEILRVLATGKTPLKNNVIFLFNGAEENPLQASHGFLSQQKWSKEVKVVINLDAAGAGGREILFQTTGEPWLAKIYAEAVPYPTAGVQGEELFHYGIIPSDTDFRIFRDFGKYSGFDIAHCTNGYIYHTKFDTVDFVHPGVFQNTGDNMLALVRQLINSSELGMTHPKTRIVYFDVFTLFMVAYSEEFSIILNVLTVFLSVFSIYRSLRNLGGGIWSALRNFVLAIGGLVLGLLLAGGAVLLIPKILDFFKSTMSWYLRPWLIIPLYSFPIVIAVAYVLLLTEKCVKKDSLQSKIIVFLNGAQLLWTLVVLVGTLKGVRSSFMIMFFILFPSIGSLFVTFFKRVYSARTYLATYLSCLVFPLLFVLCQAVRVFIVMIPMTARMGPHKNPEVIIGGLTFLCSVIYLSFIIPCLLLLRNLRKFLFIIFILHAIAMIAVICTNFGFPYDGNVQSPALQRFQVLHCERTFHDAKGSVRRVDSGIFIQSLDRNNMNYLSKFVPELRKSRRVSDDCANELFCGFPVFTSRFIKPAPYSYWIPAGPPTIHHPTSLEIVNQTQILINLRRIRILITGPDHITVGLSPRRGVELVNWSFDSPPVKNHSWRGRKTYMIYYSHGLVGGTLEFDVDLEIDQTHSDHVLDIAVIGHYMHDKKFRTPEFEKILSKFPDWAHASPWASTYKSWVV